MGGSNNNQGDNRGPKAFFDFSDDTVGDTSAGSFDDYDFGGSTGFSVSESDIAGGTFDEDPSDNQYQFNEMTKLAENLQAEKLEKEIETKNFLGKPKGETINILGVNVSPSDLVPGGVFLNFMQQLNYQMQADALRRGGTIVEDDEGNYVGVIDVDGQYTGDAAFSPYDTPGDDGEGQVDTASTVTPRVTPERTEEVVPDDTIMERSRGTRRTRRLGAAGTLIEGYGVLQRGKGTSAVI
tara:strand:- start:5330 stop:6046 length:717 start_codon:yes stop_codon:yes gene_type:complete